jgi:hypothetical protein
VGCHLEEHFLSLLDLWMRWALLVANPCSGKHGCLARFPPVAHNLWHSCLSQSAGTFFLRFCNLWRNVSTFTEQLKPNSVAVLNAISATDPLTCTVLSLFSLRNCKRDFLFSNILVICAGIVGVADCDMSLHRSLRSGRRYNSFFSFNLQMLLINYMLKLRRYW